jgi:quercetin dioxygenase-like cupin family protein
MTHSRLKIIVLIIGMLFYSIHSFADVHVLRSQDMPEIKGKEGVMLTVSMAPGESSPMHRHNAHTFVYVLEGSVVMQVEGNDAITLKQGDTFYESLNDVHQVSKNASDKLPAKFLVFFVKDKGAPLLVPIK